MTASHSYDVCLKKYDLILESFAYAEGMLESLKKKEEAGADLSSDVNQDLLEDVIACLLVVADEEEGIGKWVDDTEADWMEEYREASGLGDDEVVLPPELDAFYTPEVVEVLSHMSEIFTGEPLGEDLDLHLDEDFEFDFSLKNLESMIRFFKVSYVDRGRLMLERLKSDA